MSQGVYNNADQDVLTGWEYWCRSEAKNSTSSSCVTNVQKPVVQPQIWVEEENTTIDVIDLRSSSFPC